MRVYFLSLLPIPRDLYVLHQRFVILNILHTVCLLVGVHDNTLISPKQVWNEALVYFFKKWSFDWLSIIVFLQYIKPSCGLLQRAFTSTDIFYFYLFKETLNRFPTMTVSVGLCVTQTLWPTSLWKCCWIPLGSFDISRCVPFTSFFSLSLAPDSSASSLI